MNTVNIPADTVEITVITDHPVIVSFDDAEDGVIECYEVRGSTKAFVREIERLGWHLADTVEWDSSVNLQVYKKAAR